MSPELGLHFSVGGRAPGEERYQNRLMPNPDGPLSMKAYLDLVYQGYDAVLFCFHEFRREGWSLSRVVLNTDPAYLKKYSKITVPCDLNHPELIEGAKRPNRHD